MRSFNLQYKGVLHSDQTSNGARRRRELHDIRRAFHLQLFKAWQLTPMLREASIGNFGNLPYRGEPPRIWYLGKPLRTDTAWAKTKRRNIEFVPLVIRAQLMSLICELDIRVFWREKRQGGILRQQQDGFDLDSRLKGLLDSLTIPQENQLPDDTASDPVPFLCLLENDNLVSRITIEAHPLGLPPSPSEQDAYVEIDVSVQIDGDELGEDV